MERNRQIEPNVHPAVLKFRKLRRAIDHVARNTVENNPGLSQEQIDDLLLKATWAEGLIYFGVFPQAKEALGDFLSSVKHPMDSNGNR